MKETLCDTEKLIFPKITYSEIYLLELIKNKKVTKVKKYINSYFYKLANNTTVLFWNAVEQQFNLLDDQIIKNRYFPKYLSIDNGYSSFNIFNWFFSIENFSYYPCSVINKPTLFIDEKTKTRFINLFSPLLHGNKKIKKLKDYDKIIQEGVNKIWDHINIVWCSRKKDQFIYIQNWISHMVSGKKMKTAIYLRSIEGVGKSIVIEFLSTGVLGENLVLQTANSSIISDKFNAPLAGKMVFCLEEAPCSTLGEWKTLDSKMKNLITENKLCLEKKGKDAIMIENTVSTILNSNLNAIILNSFSRRYCTPDISNEKRGDHKYFAELAKIMQNKIIGEAFYFNCIEIAKKTKDFIEQKIPVSDELKKNVSDNANSVYLFIKENYILKKENINIKYSEFYKKYEEYCKYKKINYIIKKSYTVDKLKEIEINYIKEDTKHNNLNWITNTYQELILLFEKYHLINDTDDYKYNTIDNNDNSSDVEDKEYGVNNLTLEENKLKEENIILKKEIEELKKEKLNTEIQKENLDKIEIFIEKDTEWDVLKELHNKFKQNYQKALKQAELILKKENIKEKIIDNNLKQQLFQLFIPN